MLGMNELAAASTSSGGFNPSTLIFILIIVAVVYLLMIRPQQRRRQQAQQKQNTLQPGVRVRTTAGMYATVVAVDGDDVILECAPGVEVRYMKRAIMDVLGPEEPEEPADEDLAAEADGEYSEEQSPDDAVQDDTVGDVSESDADEVEETAYEQATGTKKD